MEERKTSFGNSKQKEYVFYLNVNMISKVMKNIKINYTTLIKISISMSIINDLFRQ